ncbi:MAG: 23S rRNA (pseudouridine(1915)-N(3))-methyltransferase RlmH [Gammaproteobacteria bacterium]|nr:23S rRNA (pseudouridine(1915)-N(3))-methyltransferase RlmH [Gammaproteobacteria bacterium]
MQLRLVAVGTKMPAWVQQGYTGFATRMPRECQLSLTEIPIARKGRGATEEGERILAAVPQKDLVVALEVTGRPWSTEQLAQQLENWRGSGRNVSLLIGGPDGLSDACRDRADQKWSLSPLTFPHALVRIIVAEQLYRAWTILQNHPYHRP